MTDFLTRLAQRTLGLASVVQPRLASRYAPADEVTLGTTPTPFATPQPASEGLKVPRIPSESLSQTGPDANLETHNPVSLNLTESPIIDSSQAPQNDSTLLPASVQLTASPAHSSERLVKDTPFLPQQPLERQGTIAPTDECVEPQFSSSSRVVEPSTAPLPQSFKQSEQLSQAQSAQLSLVPPIIDNFGILSSQSSEKGQETTIEQETTIGLPLVTLEARTPSDLTARQSSLEHLSASLPQPNQPPNEPVIEVRIGRIEVRGIQPAPQKERAKSTPSTPALSLSDYLNRRDGGKS